MLNVWSVSTGVNLATVIEGVALERVSTGTDTRIPLPLTLAKSFQGVPPPAFDGTGHHPTAPLTNSAGSSFARSGVNSFADGISAISTGQLNARVISTLVVKDAVNHGTEADPNGYSGMMYAFGQFLTHDLEFARPGTTTDISVRVPGVAISFTITNASGLTSYQGNQVLALYIDEATYPTISQSAGNTWWIRGTGITQQKIVRAYRYAVGTWQILALCPTDPGDLTNASYTVLSPDADLELYPGSLIPVFRSAVAPGTGLAGIAATPINDVTGWIDASVVYGIQYPPGVTLPPAPNPFANPFDLREGGRIASTGRLITTNNGRYGPVDEQGQFIFGDPRGSENPDLASIQTLFIREHNWHVNRLADINPAWSGEQLYQRARSIVIAEIQHITFKEWLPKVVGESSIPEYTGFKPGVNATTNVEFSVAAMRFGHSIVSGALDRINEQGVVTSSTTLAQAFFMPATQVQAYGGADGFIRKLCSDVSNKLDVYIIDDLRNLLNDPPAALDLAATNIQRGRDVGLPTLNQMRQAFGLINYTSFDQITTDQSVRDNLRAAYGDVNKVELWLGGLAETPAEGAMVGQTFQTIILDQMIRLRDGDAQWYQNVPWSSQDLGWIENTTMSDVILRNTDTVLLQLDAFRAVDRDNLISGLETSAVPRTAEAVPTIDTSGLPNINFKIISGGLPAGLRIDGPFIAGRPANVINTATSKFVIRAQDATTKEVADRTFTIGVSGPDMPTWNTPGGYLPIGIENEYYGINKQYVNFKLSATPTESPDGTTLKYFIANGGGELPPGLSLSDNGIISGFLSDSLVFDGLQSATGGYDDESYDNYSYDHYADTTSTSIGLPKIYNFRVTASDGISNTSSIFKILVVNPGMIKSPESVPVQWPIRELYSVQLTTSTFTYTNVVNNVATITTGTTFDVTRHNHGLTTGTHVTLTTSTTATMALIGNKTDFYINIKSANTFTLYTDSSLTNILRVSTLAIGSGTFVATASIYTYLIQAKADYLPPLQFIRNSDLGVIRANNNQDLDVSAYDPYPSIGTIVYGISTSTDVSTQLPPDLRLDIQNGLIYGVVPYQPAYSKNYSLSIFALRYASTLTNIPIQNIIASSGTVSIVSSTNVFSLIVKGEVESTIAWVSTGTVGTIATGIPSELYVKAQHLTSDYSIKYTKTSGTIPPGLTLERDGTLSGSVTHGSTGTYTFGIQASDVYGLSAITGTFIINVIETDTKQYTKIYARPFLPLAQRSSYQDFITNESIFDPTLMYRYFDPNFGVQSTIKVIIEFGIEKVNFLEYTNALRENFYRKRLYFGDLKIAIARDTAGNELYEVVYVDVVDDQVNSEGKSASPVVYGRNNNIYYPASINNMRAGLENIGLLKLTNAIPSASYIGVNDDYLPKFMQTAQAGSIDIAGFMKVIPLCYTLPGNGAKVISRIKLSGFDFKSVDFEVDRLIVENSLDSTSAKYLIFERQSIGDHIPEDDNLYGPDEVEFEFVDNTPNYIVLEDGSVLVFEDGTPIVTFTL
jgi:hypothetical protein